MLNLVDNIHNSLHRRKYRLCTMFLFISGHMKIWRYFIYYGPLSSVILFPTSTESFNLVFSHHHCWTYSVSCFESSSGLSHPPLFLVDSQDIPHHSCTCQLILTLSSTPCYDPFSSLASPFLVFLCTEEPVFLFSIMHYHTLTLSLAIIVSSFKIFTPTNPYFTTSS